MANDPEITITIEDIPEELVYWWLYGEALWPDVIGGTDADG